MNDNDSLAGWVELANAGDAAAQAKLWDRFFPQLLEAGTGEATGRGLRIGDEEDVVASVFQSYFRGSGKSLSRSEGSRQPLAVALE